MIVRLAPPRDWMADCQGVQLVAISRNMQARLQLVVVCAVHRTHANTAFKTRVITPEMNSCPVCDPYSLGTRTQATRRELARMEMDKIISDTVATIITSLAQRSASVTADKIKELIERLAERDPEFKRTLNLEELVAKVNTVDGEDPGEDAYTEENLARYLELPVRDLATLNPDTVEIDAIYNHVRLEHLFKQWLTEWGYIVEVGPTLKGLEGIEYVPDVYGVLSNLHDDYEVCVNFVCDRPPSELRVKGLLQDIEAYSERKETFSAGDIFVIATPRQNFTQTALTHIALQNMQEKYSIVSLDGADIGKLVNKTRSDGRMLLLRSIIADSDEDARRGRTRLPKRWSGGE